MSCRCGATSFVGKKAAFCHFYNKQKYVEQMVVMNTSTEICLG